MNEKTYTVKMNLEELIYIAILLGERKKLMYDDIDTASDEVVCINKIADKIMENFT